MGGDILDFHLARGENPVDDADKQRVKVFMLNGYVFVACEDGDDWDYNDRIYWMPYGQDRVEKATVVPVKPEPTKPQVWTYAWEDNTMEGNDRCDYDMNDCVIEVNEKADDPTMLEITIVALGATRDLWLGFENKNGKSISDYQPVFAEGDHSQDANELHKLMNASSGEMVNTGVPSYSVPRSEKRCREPMSTTSTCSTSRQQVPTPTASSSPASGSGPSSACASPRPTLTLASGPATIHRQRTGISVLSRGRSSATSNQLINQQ